MNKTTTIIKGSKNYQERKSGLLAEKLKIAAYARVSTDMEEQKNSYQTQVDYYTNMINKKSEWIFAGIYADEAITGTKVDKRVGFLNMINDAVSGKIDMIITKSISRFARNTVDTLQYVRMLKEHKIEVFFEEENIHTLSMDGELLLTILSSVAQQEVQNISEHVKLGIKHKMENGRMVVYYKCLGYDYDPNIDNLVINEEEAEAIRYIFKRYIEGYGAVVIAKEMKENGMADKIGRFKIDNTSILRILKNEKYMGDLKTGKTYTLDPIGKKKLVNYGEHDTYYTKNHHQPIIEREVFELAQNIRKERNRVCHTGHNNEWSTWSEKYAFTSKLICGCCGKRYVRKTMNGNKDGVKIIWQCKNYIINGKKACKESKAIRESVIKEAFVQVYKKLISESAISVDAFLKKVEDTLKKNIMTSDIEKLKSKIISYQTKLDAVVDLKLENRISDEQYEKKYSELSNTLQYTKQLLKKYENSGTVKDDIKERLKEFKSILDERKDIDEFNDDIFNSMVERVVIGRFDNESDVDPYYLRFILKGGFYNNESIEKQEYEADYMEMINLEISSHFTEFYKIDEYTNGRRLVKTVHVSAGFSNEMGGLDNHDLEHLKEQVFLKSKSFMGDKTNSELAVELGVCDSTISDYKKRIKNGTIINQR